MKRPIGFDDKREPDSRRTPVPAPEALVTPFEPAEPREREQPREPAEPSESAEPSSDPSRSQEQPQLSPEQLVTDQSKRAREALRALKAARRERRRRERGEQKRFTRWSRARRKRWLIALSAVLGLAAFVAIGVLTPVMSLQKITVVGAERLDAAAISEGLASQMGTPLALIDESRVKNTLSEFSLIQEYSIEVIPPNELIVRVVERRPVLSIKRGERFDLVDPAGVVIETTDARVPGFPIGDALVVDVNSPAFKAAAQSLAYMQPDLASQVDVASATTDQDVSFRLASGVTVIWGSAEQSLRKSLLVKTMISSLAGRPVSTIDVSSVEAPVFS